MLSGTPDFQMLLADDPSSTTYVRMKGNARRRVGAWTLWRLKMPQSTTTAQLLAKFRAERQSCCARYLLQHPENTGADRRKSLF